MAALFASSAIASELPTEDELQEKVDAALDGTNELLKDMLV